MKSERSIIFVEQVYEDISEIMLWYSLQSDGLEKEFLLSFDACISKVQRNPRAFAKLSGASFSALLNRFPYRVIYKIYRNKIVVFGVFHTKRDPIVIKKRLK